MGTVCVSNLQKERRACMSAPLLPHVPIMVHMGQRGANTWGPIQFYCAMMTLNVGHQGASSHGNRIRLDVTARDLAGLMTQLDS